jgi:hypothetical protein
MEEESDPGKEIMHDARRGLVSLFAHINLGYRKMKALMPTAALQAGSDKALSPVEDLKLNIEQGVLCYSQHINKNYPFMSSMAKAHQAMLTTQVGIGCGAIATIAFKSVVRRRVRLFVGVSALMALDTYALCELCKFQERHKKVNVKQISYYNDSD